VRKPEKTELSALSVKILTKNKFKKIFRRLKERQ